MLEQEIGSRLREGDLLSRYYEPKNVAKRPKNPKVLVSKSLHEGFATHFFVDRLWFKLETKTARGNYADIYIICVPFQRGAVVAYLLLQVSSVPSYCSLVDLITHNHHQKHNHSAQ